LHFKFGAAYHKALRESTKSDLGNAKFIHSEKPCKIILWSDATAIFSAYVVKPGPIGFSFSNSCK